MPELPEVETIVRQLRPKVLGRRIVDFQLINSGDRLIRPYTTVEIADFVFNETIEDVLRHGKYIIMDLSNDKFILAHLRMTGRFEVTKRPSTSIHNRLYFELDNAQFFNFLDIRKFATLEIENAMSANQIKKIQKLGPDAITDFFNLKYLYAKTSNCKRTIYSLLMDQTVVAGIGNIYANESLFRAKIHPKNMANELSQRQIAKLVQEIKSILEFAISFKGTTLIDNTFTGLDGENGEFAKLLQVYSRAGQICKKCSSTIERLKLAQRSVFICPSCQKLPS